MEPEHRRILDESPSVLRPMSTLRSLPQDAVAEWRRCST
jgi:hypothetical protein